METKKVKQQKNNSEKVNKQEVTLTGTVGNGETEIFCKVQGFGNGDKMVVRTKLFYCTDSAVDQNGGHISDIEIEMWNEIAAKFLTEKKDCSTMTLKVTGELFSRTYTREGETVPRKIHRINVSNIDFIEKQKVKNSGKYSKFLGTLPE